MQEGLGNVTQRRRLDRVISSEPKIELTSEDRAKAEQAIDRLYALCGRDPPAIVWCRSFYQLAILPSMLFAIFYSDLWQFVSSELTADHDAGEQAWLDRWNELFAEIWHSAGVPILHRIYASSQVAREYMYLEETLVSQVKSALTANLCRGRLQKLQQMLKREIYRKVWYTELRQEVIKDNFVQLKLDALEQMDRLGEFELAPHNDEFGVLRQQGRALTDTFHALAQRLGGDPALQASRVLWMAVSVSWLNLVASHSDDIAALFGHLSEPLELWLTLAETVSAVLSYEGITFLCEIPTTCYLNDGARLHNESGPALTYSDGFAQYAWHGAIVPQRFIEEPESISVEQIETETNTELRRVMLERYGEERFLNDSFAVPIHQDEFGTLFRKELPGDEALVMVRVLNATVEPDGSHRYYYLRVPPTLVTAQGAVAWTFGFDNPDDYKPEVQT